MTKSFEFGLLLHARHLIRDSRPPSFDDPWEDAAYAEEVGFDRVWLGDSVTLLDKARRDCLILMAALAAKTERIRIGTIPLLLAQAGWRLRRRRRGEVEAGPVGWCGRRCADSRGPTSERQMR